MTQPGKKTPAGKTCRHVNNLWKSVKTPKLCVRSTFFQEVGDVGLELVPNTDLPLIGQQGLLLRVVHQRVEEGILGNTDIGKV